MIHLFTDLDRTIIPNGDQPESPDARPLFRRLTDSELIQLVYVSGRDKRLVRQAIADFNLPSPAFVIGDVGTTIYRVTDRSWQYDTGWEEKISADWKGCHHGDIVDLLSSSELDDDLELQPDEAQGVVKVSYFTDPGGDGRSLRDSAARILDDQGIDVNLIWSVDEEKNRGLLDILPASANKVSAIRFVMQQDDILEERVVFAGDSGNDLDSLTSGLKAILVANAHPDVRSEALKTMREKGCSELLYPARGGFLSLNGNYAAGVLEGMAHFFPEAADWLTRTSGNNS